MLAEADAIGSGTKPVLGVYGFGKAIRQFDKT